MALINVAKCDKITVTRGDRATCPMCGWFLPGRYPHGVTGALLRCSNRRCIAYRETVQVDIVPADQPIDHGAP